MSQLRVIDLFSGIGGFRSERIVSVAIMTGNSFVTPMNDRWRHGDLIAEMARIGFPTPITGEQGFCTDKPRFVSRRIAMGIALEAGQIDISKPYSDELFSEDLW